MLKVKPPAHTRSKLQSLILNLGFFLLLCLALVAAPHASAQANFSNVTVTPLSGTADGSGQLTVTATGSTSASSSSDSVSKVMLMEGATTLSLKTYPVSYNSSTGYPINTTRSINLTAGLPPGTHTLFLRSYLWDSGETADSQAFVVTVAAATLVDGATYVSQGVPSSMLAGQSYNVSVTMRNSGTTTWTSGGSNPYRLGVQNPANNSTWGTGRVELPSSVAPGNSVTFNFTVTAPSTAGTYNFQWQMLQENVLWFGDYAPNVPVTVTLPQPTASFSSPNDGATFNATGTTATVSFSGSAGAGTGATLSTVQLLENGVAFASGTSSSISGGKDLSVGTHTIELRVTDSRNQVAHAYRTVKVLAPPPTASFTSPKDGASFATTTNTASVAVSATGTPGAGASISQVRLYVDGALTSSIATGALSSSVSLAVGSHTLGVEAVDNFGTTGPRSNISVTVTAPTPAEGPAAAFLSTLDVPHLSNPDAGTLPGELSVDSSGKATYHLPLVVPPGTNGMQPALSLNYKNDSPNGLVGLGWSVGGLSSIHRCGKTIAQDSVNDRISFTNSDRLCLDGQRLILANREMSDGNYWTPGAQYRTELESFARITLTNDGPNGALSFVVESRDGRISTYGRSATSSVKAIVGVVHSGTTAPQPSAKSGPQSWALDRTVDRVGNFMEVTYEQDGATGEHRPLYILYGGAGLSAHAAVQFLYESRPDAWTRYIDETRNDLRSRVTHIKTYVGDNLDVSNVASSGTLVRDYTLTYDQSPTSGRSLLSSVDVCARHPVSGAIDCLPATTFTWGKPNKAPGFVSRGMWAGAPILTTNAPSGPDGNFPRAANHSDYFAFSDFDHDGFADVLEKRVASMWPSDYNTSYDTQVRESTNPIKPGTMQSSYRFFHNTGNGFATYNYRIDSGEPFVVLDVGDFDGDGALDLFVYGNGPKICLSPLANPAALGAPGSTITFRCGSALPGNWRNEPGGRAYTFDALGDGRSAVYSTFQNDHATFCNLSGCESDSNPPYIVGVDDGSFDNPYDGHPGFAAVEFTSFTQMADFTGIGKSYDTRWTGPYFQQYAKDGNETVQVNRWNNLTPRITMTSLGRPGEGTGSMADYTYPGYPNTLASTGTLQAPYRFDKPYQGNSLTSDFNGSGYTGLAFGFIEFGSSTDVAWKRAEMTLCLSTGRALDCAVRQKYSGDNYRAISAVGNFVGDGTGAILVQPLTQKPYVGLAPSGDIEMCRVMGDDTTGGIGTADNNLVCTPWGGLKLPEDSGSGSVSDKVYFMDLLGTGRTQLVYYHSGKIVNGGWQEDGRWEVFEPIDVAADGEALDRIVRVTNGIGATASVEYADALSSGLVAPPDSGASGGGSSDLGYWQQPVRMPGKLVRRLISSNGVGDDRRVSYRYYDAATDLAGRGWLGFLRVESTDEQTGFVTTTSYKRVWPFTGMATAVSTKAGGCEISVVSTMLDARAIKLANGATTTLPYVSTSTTARRDLNNCSELGTVSTANTYGDDWGNLTNQEVTSTGAGETFTTATTTDFLNDEGRWLLGLPLHSVTKKTTPSVAAQEPRTVDHEYDPITGLLTKDTLEKGDSRYEVTTEYVRAGNPFGLVNKKTQTWSDASGSHVRTVLDITYDSKGRYPATAKNALGHTEAYEYFPATGVRKSLKDPNGLTTSWTADGFGRVQVELHADGNEIRSYLKACEGQCPLGAALAQITETFHGASRISAPQVNYSDTAGHLLRSLTWGFDGRAIVTDQRYDQRGRVFEQDWPRFEQDSAYLKTRTLYDELDRTTRITSLDEGGAAHDATIDYNGFIRTLTNPLGYQRVETRNVLDQLKSVRDPNQKLTQFDYEAFGSLSKTTDPNGNVITIGYDRLGRKVDLYDPDLGHIEYRVDPLGRTVEQISPKQRAAGQSATVVFDNLDRMTDRFETDLESHWKYDSAVMGIGKLAEAYTQNGTVVDYRRIHTYDKFGRAAGTTQTLSDGTYINLAEYDDWGRPVRQSYQRNNDAAKVFEQRYAGTGYLERVVRGNLSIWSVSSQDAALRVTDALLGNGLIQHREYNQYTGRLWNGSLKTGSGVARLQEGYEYDVIGDVNKRTEYWGEGESMLGFQERFHYDALNRIDWSEVEGQARQNFAYDAAGNLSSKTGVGTGNYDYGQQGVGAARPHAVKSIPGVGSFDYDDNGNLVSGNGRTMIWTSFDMPSKMSNSNASASFVYGPEHQRVRQDRGDGSTVVYAGGQEVETNNGQVTVKTYWPAGIGVEIDRPGANTTELNWTYVDRLGSVIAITDENGEIREKLAYDAWGKRRTLDGAPVNGTVTPDSIDGHVDNRGFTGHEMLDQLDLVHMNGRVYDPAIARFVSADPIISDPLDGQRYNRFSYVLNNPTNLTDPTGFEEAEVDSSENGKVGSTGTRIKSADGCPWCNVATTVYAAKPVGTVSTAKPVGSDSNNAKNPYSTQDNDKSAHSGQASGKLTASGQADDKKGEPSPYHDKNREANVIYHETSSLKPVEGKTTDDDLHKTRVDAAHVYNNLNDKSKFQDSGTLSEREQKAIADGYRPSVRAYKDSLSAVDEASKAPDTTNGSKHFFVRDVTAGDKQKIPSWANGTQIVHGPFTTTSRGDGAIQKGDTVEIWINNTK